jgi:hypothetical protein
LSAFNASGLDGWSLVIEFCDTSKGDVARNQWLILNPGDRLLNGIKRGGSEARLNIIFGNVNADVKGTRERATKMGKRRGYSKGAGSKVTGIRNRGFREPVGLRVHRRKSFRG